MYAICLIAAGTLALCWLSTFTKRVRAEIVARGNSVRASRRTFAVATVILAAVSVAAAPEAEPPRPSRHLPAERAAAPAAATVTSPWYVGGTLHDVTIAEWRSATPANRLATSADFVAQLAKVREHRALPEAELIERATGLEICVSTGGKQQADQELNATVDAMTVRDVVTFCYVAMGGE
jgi:hypothetical protein